MGRIDPRLRYLVSQLDNIREWSEAKRQRWGVVPSEPEDPPATVRVSVFVQSIGSQSTPPDITSFRLSTQREGIATGTVRLDRVEMLRDLDRMVLVSAASQLHALLNLSVPAIQATQVQSQYTGSGVIVGFVDSGIDWNHPNFSNANGSRILWLKEWGGTEWDQSQINAGQCTHQDTGGHGTLVAGIAVGNGNAAADPGDSPGHYKGVAPEADIIMVDGNPLQVVGYTVPTMADTHLADAVEYLFNKAGDTPLVVNLSVGDSFGPHDGKTLLEQRLNNLIEAHGERKAIVVAAGNGGNGSRHVTGNVAPDTTTDVPFCVPNDLEADEIDVWYPKECRFMAKIVSPNQDSTGWVLVGDNPSEDEFGANPITSKVTIDSDLEPDIDADVTTSSGNRIWILIDHVNASPGQWTLKLRGVSGSPEGKFDAWIRSKPRRDTTPEFVSTSTVKRTEETTIYTPGNASNVITVGGYVTRIPEGVAGIAVGDLDPFSSLGGTRDGRPKPDVMAPDAEIRTTMSSHHQAQPQNGPIQQYWLEGGGTSMAAPHVAGVIALMLEKDKAYADQRSARSRFGALIYSIFTYHPLTAESIKRILRETASRPSGAAAEAWGSGKINAEAALDRVPDIESPFWLPSVVLHAMTSTVPRFRTRSASGRGT